MIKREEIKVHKSDNHYFLEIDSPGYDIFRSFDTLDDLIKHLMKYPIKAMDELIKEIKRNDK